MATWSCSHCPVVGEAATKQAAMNALHDHILHGCPESARIAMEAMKGHAGVVVFKVDSQGQREGV